MKSGIDGIRFILLQFLVGAASSREKKSLYSHRGWKPLPQSKSLKLAYLNFFWFQ